MISEKKLIVIVIYILKQSNKMDRTNGNINYLLKCKLLQQQNKLEDLILEDKKICYPLTLTYQQVMVSQYASGLINEIINPSYFKHSLHYSLPLLFAMFSKSLKERNYHQSYEIISLAFRDQLNSSRNKHMLLFNKAKLQSLLGNIKKATFYCECLLKEAGDRSDYYTFQFLKQLQLQNRLEEGMRIAERALEDSEEEKEKVRSIYLSMVLEEFESKRDLRVMLKRLGKFMNNKNISFRNWFNISLILKQTFPLKSLELFRQLLFAVQKTSQTQQLHHFQALIKINIFEIYQSHVITKYPQNMRQGQYHSTLLECESILQQILKFEETQALQVKCNRIQQLINHVNRSLQSEAHFLFLNSLKDSGSKLKNIENQEAGSHASASIEKKMSYRKKESRTDKYFSQKRLENEKKLKLLLKKEKQLKQFFGKLSIQKRGHKLKIKADQSLFQNGEKFFKIQAENSSKLAQYPEGAIGGAYAVGQVQQLITNFIQQWIIPRQNKKVTLKNAEKLKSFVICLQVPTCSQIRQACENGENQASNRSIQGEKSKLSSQQSFRVKSKKTSQKMLEGLKVHDNISNHLLQNLQFNFNEKKKQASDGNRQNINNSSFQSMLHKGEVLSSQNKLQQAHQHFVLMYKKFKREQEKQTLLLKIADNYERLSLFEEAEKTYIKCSKFNNVQAFFRLGTLQIRNGKIDIGIENLEKANCIQRNNPKIEIQLVYGYSLLQETTDRALALANSILKRNPSCLQALIMTSKILQRKGKLKEALDIALLIVNIIKSPSAYHYLGLLYLSDSRVSEAFLNFQNALSCDPNHVPSLIEIATIVSELNPSEAIEILKNAISLDGQNQLALARLGKLYETFQNDYQSALKIYKKGLEFSPTYENYVKIGDCQLKLGSITNAYLHYKQALNMRKTPQIYEKIAEVHEIQHQQKKAIQVYAAALAQLPKDTSQHFKQRKYLYKLGKLSLMTQQYEAAYGYLCQVALFEENTQIFKLLGQSCYGKGDYKEALKYYQKASSMQTQQNFDLLENIAMCLDKLEQYLASKEIYEKILATDPKNIKCLNNLANILLILGKTNEAFYWLQYMLQQVPNSIEKRLRVADIYSTIGDWSKVQQHLTICFKQKENDIRVLQRIVNLYKEKRDTKQLNKFEKRLALIKNNLTKNV